MTQVSKEVRKYFEEFLKEVKSGGGKHGNNSSMMSMSAARTYDKRAKVRASELPSPAPGDHFLCLFGNSDRKVVDGATREPNVGQVLSLMKGFVQDELVNNSSARLYKSLEGATTDSEKIRRLYITILSRPPSAEEISWMLDELDPGRSRARSLHHARQLCAARQHQAPLAGLMDRPSRRTHSSRASGICGDQQLAGRHWRRVFRREIRCRSNWQPG